MTSSDNQIYSQSQELYQAGEYADAIEGFRSCIKQSPQNWDARLYLGICYYKLGRLKDAEEVFLEIQESCPVDSMKQKAATALAPIQNERATGMPAGAISSVLQKPSEAQLREIHKKATGESPLPDHEITKTLPKPDLSRPPKRSLVPLPVALVVAAIGVLCPAYWGTSVLLPDMYSKMFVQPSPKVADFKAPSGVEKHDITFTGPGGVEMNAVYLHNPKTNLVVMVHHSTKGSMADSAQMVEELLKSGASVFIYDYRGFGKSKGTASVEGLIDDALIAQDHVTGNFHHKANQIIHLGVGVASGVAAEVARQRGAHSVVLISGYDNLMSIAKSKNPLFTIYPADMLPQRTYNNSAWTKEEHPEALLLSSDDTLIPPAVTKQFNEQVKDPKKVEALACSGGKCDYAPVVKFIQETESSP